MLKSCIFDTIKLKKVNFRWYVLLSIEWRHSKLFSAFIPKLCG